MNKSILLALAAIILLILWMLSGQIGDRQSTDSTATPTTEKRETTAMKVQTRRQSAQTITREVVVQGQAEPLVVMKLRAETDGRVEELMINKGQRVKRGDVIARLSIDNRAAELAVANANRVQATNEYEAARKLQKQGLQSKFNLESAAARLESTRAQVQAAELEISNTSLIAPMDALVDDIDIEIGDFVDRGAQVATLVDDSQLLITGNVPQQNIADIDTGITSTVKLITGETLQGDIRYVSSMADSISRSFRIEVLITEPPAKPLTGVSAEIRIPVETLQAHLVSPAILALDESGALGVKAVDENNEVTFHSITVVKTESNGAWVTGIPDDVNIITLGQGFVNAGEKVQTVEEPDEQATTQGS